MIIKIFGNSLFFTTSDVNLQNWTTIDGLRLNKAGILKEFPDLKDLPENIMRLEAIKRFKEHIKKLESEERIKDYLVSELSPYGYKLFMIHKEGFRPQKV